MTGGRRVLGVDEAGRGAVLGPLVVAGVLAEESARQRLRSLGARDSKTVLRHRRKDILRLVAREALCCRAVVFSAQEVDSCDLTTLTEAAVAALVGRLQPEQLVLDAPVAPAALPRFLGRLTSSLGPTVNISAYPKADSADPLVGAASLLAKVVRDGYMSTLRSQYGDIGWGYPGEERVQRFLSQWLTEHSVLPPICRHRWSSVQELLSPALSL